MYAGACPSAISPSTGSEFSATFNGLSVRVRMQTGRLVGHSGLLGQAPAYITLLDQARIIRELRGVLGRGVNMAKEKLLGNPFWRQEILKSKQVIYAV